MADKYKIDGMGLKIDKGKKPAKKPVAQKPEPPKQDASK